MLHKTSPVAGAAACLLHLLVSVNAVALPPAPHFAQLIPRDAMDAWVSVGTDGTPITIQPSVTIIDGHESTISPAPEVTFTTTEDGKTVTSTGRQPPAPTATATSGAGSFVVCDNRIGEHRPFCTPENGSKLYVGNTYYITWDPSYFDDAGNDVEIEGWYSSSRVFESRTIDAGLGFYAWTVTSDLLEGESSNSKTITLKLEYFETDSSGSTSRRLKEGPEVVVALDSKNNKGGDNGGGTKTIAIIVPLVVVAALITLLIVFFCMKKKRGGDSSAGPSKNGNFGAFGGMLKRRSTGYGERQSRSQRTGNTWAGDVGGGMPGLGGKGPAIQLDESPTSPRAPGNNVFREEIRRQERGGY